MKEIQCPKNAGKRSLRRTRGINAVSRQYRRRDATCHLQYKEAGRDTHRRALGGVQPSGFLGRLLVPIGFA